MKQQSVVRKIHFLDRFLQLLVRKIHEVTATRRADGHEQVAGRAVGLGGLLPTDKGWKDFPRHSSECIVPIWCQAAETLQVRRRVGISSPAKPSIPDRSRQSSLEEEPEGEIENSELLVAIARLSQGMSERKAEKECPGRWCFLGDFPDNGKGYRGDSHCFYRPGCQSHGPVAAPSGGNQQGVVNLGVREHTGNRRSGLFLKGFQMGTVDMSHQTVGRSVKNAQGS